MSLCSFLILIKSVVKQKDQKLLQVGLNEVYHLDLKDRRLGMCVIETFIVLHSHKNHRFDYVATENAKKVDHAQTHHEPICHLNSAYVGIFDTVLLNKGLAFLLQLRGET